MKANQFSKSVSRLSDIKHRYPNICANIRFWANLTPSETYLVIWSFKNHLPIKVAQKKLKVYGGASALVKQAIRLRNS